MDKQPVRGVIIAVLRERHRDRIVLAKSTILYLHDGDTCSHPPGTTLRVEYTIRGSRYQVDRIEIEPPAGGNPA